jgi:hypothetical protein
MVCNKNRYRIVYVFEDDRPIIFYEITIELPGIFINNPARYGND